VVNEIRMEDIQAELLSGDCVLGELLSDAFDNAGDQDQVTYVTEHGRRLFAIVPVEVAEYHEAQIAHHLGQLERIAHLRGIR
jgi:hypothetical protein